jgi:SapC
VERPAAGAERRSAALPIFYHRPRPLNAVADRGCSLQPVTDFGFARATNSVVLGAAELPHAMHSYPIVFTSREPLAAVAVLGLEDNDNLFVGEDGKWREGHYVPAYVRRYPFLFLEQPEKNELVLCIDENSGLLTRSADRPLFEDGEPTQLVRDTLAFCRDFSDQTMKSAAFVGELANRELLIPNQARIALASGREMTLHGFRIVDEAKFNALPDEVILDWRRRGWLQLVYCRLLSMAHWRGLAELAAKKQ